MIIRKQQDFDSFKCIADKCPKSCCIGWQIMIDENSLNKYKNTDGEFSTRIQSSVNFKDSSFKQHNTRCSMLNENGLCDLQSTLGEGYLCDTCRLYPRHTEEFLDLREYSLSLSCPEVVRMILEPEYDFSFAESENEACDNPEDFEDFDFLIFDKLEYARDKILEVASDKSIPLVDRMAFIANAAYELQLLYDDGEIFAMDDVKYDGTNSHSNTTQGFDYCLKTLDVLIGMEALETSWTDSIIETKKYWAMHQTDSKEWTAAMYPASELEFIFEKIFKSLLFTYFCGAIYDGQIYARAMIAVQSARYIMMIYSATGDDLASTIYLYSREVEHSDININKLIEYFEGELD